MFTVVAVNAYCAHAAAGRPSSRTSAISMRRSDVMNSLLTSLYSNARRADPPTGVPEAQRPPPTDIAIKTTMMIASTSSAIFHGLFGYSPATAPVTPFIAHWKLRGPYV